MKVNKYRCLRSILIALFVSFLLGNDVMSSDLGGIRFAHYFPVFPVSLDDFDPRVDYYSREYLSPEGEGGIHYRYGGFLNDRPLPRQRRDVGNWKVVDLIDEISVAKKAGINGFVYDLLGDDRLSISRLEDLFSAITQSGDSFKIILMPDMEATWSRSHERLAKLLCRFSGEASLLRIEDKIVVAPFNAESIPRKLDENGVVIDSKWWREFVIKKVHQECGMNIGFLPLFQGWQKFYRDYIDFSIGIADWGSRDKFGVKALDEQIQKFISNYPTKIFMKPISAGDSRPKNSRYWRSQGVNLLRTALELKWQKNIWHHIITWNDYGENTHFAPSCNTGFAYISYLGHVYNQPEFDVEDIIFFYRKHHENELPISPPVSYIEWSVGNPYVPIYDEVDMVAFLKAPATLLIELNGVSYKKTGEIGENYLSAPMRAGVPQFKIIRDENLVLSISGNCEIKNPERWQDFSYCAGSNSLKPSTYENEICSLVMKK